MGFAAMAACCPAAGETPRTEGPVFGAGSGESSGASEPSAPLRPAEPVTEVTDGCGLAIAPPDGMSPAATNPFPEATAEDPGAAGMPQEAFAPTATAASREPAPGQEADETAVRWPAAPEGDAGPAAREWFDNGRVAAPSGFLNAPGGIPAGGESAAELLEGLGLSMALTGTYDSNPSLGYGAAGDSAQGDFSTFLGGGLRYQSTASEWTLGADYTGGYTQYLNQSDLGGYSQNAGAAVNYRGGPLSATFSAGIDFGSGANRYYEAVVNQWSLSYGLSGSYRLSPKTSLTGSFSQSLKTAGGSSGSGIDSFNLAAAALWRYSARTQFGPGISYTADSGDPAQQHTSIGPTFRVSYKLSTKVSLDTQVGLEINRYEGAASTTPSVSASLGLNYRASRLWGVNLAFLRNQQADPSGAGGFTEVDSLRVGYSRKIRRAALNLGISYEADHALANDGSSSGRPDQRYLALDGSVSMPLFAETCRGSVFLSHHENRGGKGTSSVSTQTGFSLSRSF